MATFGTGGRNGQRHAVEVFDHTSKIESERGFYNWALKQVQNKGDLDVVKDWINHHGTQEQKELVAKWESHFAHPTWQSYANLHGTKYTAPISGVAEADRRAAAIIEANKAAEEAKNVVSVIEESAPIIEEGSKVTEEVSQVTNNASKFGKYAKWAIGAAAIGIVGAGVLYLLNKCTSGNNEQEAVSSKPQKQAPSNPDPLPAKPSQGTPVAPVDSVTISKPEVEGVDYVVAKKGDSYSRITKRDFMKTFTDEELAKLQERAKKYGMEVYDYVAKYYTINGQTVKADTIDVNWKHAQPNPHVGDTVRNKKPEIDFNNLK